MQALRLFGQSDSIVDGTPQLDPPQRQQTGSTASRTTSQNSRHAAMAPPSQLAIATSSLNRLVKEEASYHKEADQQQARITKLEQGDQSDENAEFTLKQETTVTLDLLLLGMTLTQICLQRKALEETKAIFPQLKQKIQDALSKLEAQLEQAKGADSSPEDITKAKEAIASAMAAVRETS
ncbi:putative tubulin-specific chaperone Rbl2 [Teratosphaeria destructans]|uniref:Tubulin-specific chaperone A n=1 Tax=Teratosphaeria destructans TaxID=418781 RepID=A0A9W7T1R7_9PEZI|nr:putative tubulin-specific chaperone Rbl2 [Teratosphaeria destructans]